MTIRVQLDGSPLVEDGRVTVWVKISGLKAPVSKDELGPLCEALVIRVPWGDNQVTIHVSVPRALSQDEASLALNVFHDRFTRRQNRLMRIISLVRERLCYHDE